jgi:hypothetical protein
VASKIVVRTTPGPPAPPGLRTALTSTGSVLPSARTISRATSRTSPCIRSRGA